MRTLALFLGLHLSLLGAASATESGAAFLSIGAGARSAGMGGAYTAMASDASALYWNPAGMASLKSTSFDFTHTRWILETKHDYFALAMPAKAFGLGEKGAVAFGVTRLGLDGVDARAEDGSLSSGNLEASDSAYSVGFALPGLRYGLSGGFSLKWIRSTIGAFSANTFAADVGLKRKAALGAVPMELGFAVRNLGPGLRFIRERDPLPTQYTVGTAATFQKVFKVSADLGYLPNDSRFSAAIGTEFSPIQAFSVRAGYLSGAPALSNEEGSGSSLSPTGLAGGVGLAFGDYRLNYSFSPFGELGSVHHIGLSGSF